MYFYMQRQSGVYLYLLFCAWLNDSLVYSISFHPTHHRGIDIMFVSAWQLEMQLCMNYYTEAELCKYPAYKHVNYSNSL